MTGVGKWTRKNEIAFRQDSKVQTGDSGLHYTGFHNSPQLQKTL
jgi:hypothetical protein